ncbi:MAG: protein-disulfide reductase DsbD domain-containing protein, partial [Natronospirillum sp.]
MNRLVATALLTLSTLVSAQDFQFLPVNEAMPMSFHSDGSDLVVDWVIQPEHYMYRNMTSIALVDGADATLGEMRLPNHFVERYDETFDEVMPIYYEFQTLRVAVDAAKPVDLVV